MPDKSDLALLPGTSEASAMLERANKLALLAALKAQVEVLEQELLPRVELPSGTLVSDKSVSIEPPGSKPILCLDFDGVCHSYMSGWQGATVIPDPVVPGLFEFLEAAAPHFNIQIFSSRSHQTGGIDAMITWFIEQRHIWLDNGGQAKSNLVLTFPTNKPPAHVTIDDRAFCFEGKWPSISGLIYFKPWFKRV